jgi:hypothetical protein
MTAISTNPLSSWATLVNVLFGSIASISFHQFHQTLVAMGERTVRHITFRAFLFVCCFAFFVYDWAVLARLIAEFPYQPSAFSSVMRFVDDLVMGFMLLGVTWLGSRADIEKHVLLLVTFLITWHLGAAAWHTLAALQYGLQNLQGSVLAWHLIIAPLTYTAAWTLGRLIYRLRIRKASRLRDMPDNRNRYILCCVGCAVLGLSVIRTLIAFDYI